MTYIPDEMDAVAELMHAAIVSVVVTFWMVVMWGGWPFNLAKNPVTAGLATLVACYVVNFLLFRLFFNYGFMEGAVPPEVMALDPAGERALVGEARGWSARGVGPGTRVGHHQGLGVVQALEVVCLAGGQQMDLLRGEARGGGVQHERDERFDAGAAAGGAPKVGGPGFLFG